MSVPPSPPLRKTLRVLCLHGFRTNAQVMQEQMRSLRETLGDDSTTEFVYLNGPFEAEGDAFLDIEQLYAHTRPFYEWLQFTALDNDESLIMSPAATKRMRERVGDGGDEWFLRFKGVETALAHLHTQLRALGPFDVAIGFSQGGLMLTVLAMWCLHTRNERWWRLTVCVSSCRVNGLNVKHLFVDGHNCEKRVPFPSVHVIGKLDPVRRESLKLIEMYDSRCLVLEHADGHRFPSVSRHAALYATLAGAMNAYRRSEQTTIVTAVQRPLATSAKL